MRGPYLDLVKRAGKRRMRNAIDWRYDDIERHPSQYWDEFETEFNNTSFALAFEW